MDVAGPFPEVVRREREQETRGHGHLIVDFEPPQHEQRGPGRQDKGSKEEQVARQEGVADQQDEQFEAEERASLGVGEVVRLHGPRGAQPGVLEVTNRSRRPSWSGPDENAHRRRLNSRAGF